jgi:hypothetical protein
VELTRAHSFRLKKAYADIGEVLQDLGVVEAEPARPADPKWMRDTAKQWGLLNSLAVEHGGDAGSDAWARLGRQHGYDPRGLGGFFVGSQPLMASQGARRVLTVHGRRFIDRWRADFEG